MKGRKNILNIDKENYGKEYYNKVYKPKLLKKIECDLCSKSISQGSLRVHKLSKEHKYYELKQKNIADIECKKIQDHDVFMDDMESKYYPYILNKAGKLTHVYDIFNHKWSKEDAIKNGLLKKDESSLRSASEIEHDIERSEKEGKQSAFG